MTTSNEMPNEIPTDPELIRVLAEKGMGWELRGRLEWGDLWYNPDKCEYAGGSDKWNPLTDANDRDMLVEAIGERFGWGVNLDYASTFDLNEGEPAYWAGVSVGNKGHYSAKADNPGTAICNAVYKALMAEK